MSLLAALEPHIAAAPSGAILVAFSGGMDSTVLLHALAQMQAARARGLRAIHVDHSLHPDSPRWRVHCEHFARALEIPLACRQVTVARDSGTGLEDAARAARFAAFAEDLRAGELLALAQHREDQAETVLLKLLRGAGPEGLGGMRTLRPFAAGHLWRPLLDVPRQTLFDYARQHDLAWIDDPSNTDTGLRRNFLRHEVLPRLTTVWPEASTALAHSANWARAATDFIREQARTALARVQGPQTATLRWRQWLDLSDALRDPVLRLWLRELGLDAPAHFHVAELERQLESARDRRPCLSFGQTQLRRYRDLLHAVRPPREVPPGWETRWDGSPLELPGGGRLLLDRMPVAPANLAVRYRRGGERLQPENAVHTRELRNLLQEAGIPPWQRERMPLVYAEGELLAVGDLWLSAAGRRWCEAHATGFVFEPFISG